MKSHNQRDGIVAASSSQIAPAYVKALASIAQHYQTIPQGYNVAGGAE
jgi:hypothetical protein